MHSCLVARLDGMLVYREWLRLLCMHIDSWTGGEETNTRVYSQCVHKEMAAFEALVVNMGMSVARELNAIGVARDVVPYFAIKYRNAKSSTGDTFTKLSYHVTMLLFAEYDTLRQAMMHILNTRCPPWIAELTEKYTAIRKRKQDDAADTVIPHTVTEDEWTQWAAMLFNDKAVHNNTSGQPIQVVGSGKVQLTAASTPPTLFTELGIVDPNTGKFIDIDADSQYVLPLALSMTFPDPYSCVAAPDWQSPSAPAVTKRPCSSSMVAAILNEPMQPMQQLPLQWMRQMLMCSDGTSKVSGHTRSLAGWVCIQQHVC